MLAARLLFIFKEICDQRKRITIYSITDKKKKISYRLLFLARFIPGARMPGYVLAGFSRLNFLKVVLVILVANIIWTPALVYLSYLWGTAIYAWLDEKIAYWWVFFLGVLLFYSIFSLAIKICTQEGRLKIGIFLEKIGKVEFWPPFLFYLPLIPYLFWLMIRYRSWNCFTACNPSIPAGGIIGESKSEILKLIPQVWRADSFIVEAKKNRDSSINIKDSIDYLFRQIDGRGWSFPFVVKPDQGQRGSGFRLIHNEEECEVYLRQYLRSEKIIAQEYHGGPFELGIFYVRHPQQHKGKIFSITDKRFPFVIGDGTRSLAKLIDQHPRYKMQRNTFRERFGDRLDTIPKAGEKIHLARAGNHCQGTMFLDGQRWLTRHLEESVDKICKNISGFYFGRFDVRYSDPVAFKKGKDFVIIELNGATSESTNIYDPCMNFLESYRILFRQWKILFEIGSFNVRQGYKKTTIRQIIRALLQYHIDHRNLPSISD